MKGKDMFERIRIYLKYEIPELIDKFFIGLCLSLIIVCAVGGGMLTFRSYKEEQRAMMRIIEIDKELREMSRKQRAFDTGDKFSRWQIFLPEAKLNSCREYGTFTMEMNKK